MPSIDQTLQSLIEYEKETHLLASIDALLNWDERTGLPAKAGEFRAEQISYLSGVIHERNTAPQLGEWLDTLSNADWMSDPHSDQATVVRQLKRDYVKNTKLPSRLVKELTKQSVLGQQAWVEARQQDSFQHFEPFLGRMISLKQEQAETIGYEEEIYDALLDDYEPEEKTSNVRKVLAELREALVPLVDAIASSKKRPDESILHRKFPIEQQQVVGREAAEQIGFDFARGRLDVTTHPFCTDLGPHDIRILTRYNESFFNESFFGTLHEAGHGIYEQGLRTEWVGLPPGKYLSLGIHESQSRMWENLVGRSHAFWKHYYTKVQTAFPQSLSSVTCEQFFGAVNDVRPSLIRVEADEVTYNLHIIIRFELEQDLLAGKLTTAQLPDAWNAKYESYLGITPPSAKEGVLQDVHWSAGLFGYFPTYSIGNLYSAQMFAAAEAELGDLNVAFEQGDFAGLKGWLTKNVYQKGQCYRAAELIEDISGKPLSHEPLIAYLKAKLGTIYDL